VVEKARDALGASRFPKPNERFGIYQIEALIDEDKSGRVYKAKEDNSEKDVCLKVLSSELTRNSSFIDVLRIQMQAATSLNDPGIAELYEIGAAEDVYYVASEWAPAGWLSQEIVQSGKFTLSDALEVIIKCAETLQSASEIRIFHGNLRLNSVLIFPGKQIKISEIGFAAAVRALYGPTNLPIYLGTARFLAPEMTGSGPVDHRADIYSLGLILYFMLFSVTPFRYEGEKLAGNEETIEIEYMDEVLKIVSKMTENNPDKRYQDYESLLQDLRLLFARSAPSVKVPVINNAGSVIKNQKLFKLLCVLYASSTNGALTVLDAGISRTFFIRKRDIIYFESSLPEESILTWLIEKKEIDARHQPADQEPLQRVLSKIVSKGFVKLEDLRYRYQELANRILSELLKKPLADAEFISADIDGEPLCTLRLSGLLLKAARYTVDLKDVLSEIKSDTYLNRTGLFDHLVTGLQLSDEENLLVQVSQDGIFTGSLRVTPGSSSEKGIRFLYLLKQIGALEVRQSAAPAPPAVTPSAARPAPASVPPKPETTLEEDFHLEGQPEDIRGSDSIKRSDSIRMEVQRTAKKVDRERLDQEADKRFDLAKQSYKAGKYWEASHLCEQALGLHEDGRYYWLMGLSYAQHPRFRHKAEDSFHRAVKLDPLNDELHADLADFYVTQGLFLRARTHCMKALEIIPDQIRAREILKEPAFENLGAGGCCCEHDPVCNHIEHRAWRK
jgi:serine/threonine protein kinase/tetratricopeptide (TPR) repeat protein